MEMARKAKRAEKAGHRAEAYILYSEAYALRPKSKKYKALMAAVKPAPEIPPPEDNAPSFDSLTGRELQAPPELKTKPGIQDFNLIGPPRSLFDQVAQRFGLATVYDGGYPLAGPPVRFQITAADYREALHDLEAATGSFVIPLSARLFMVASDTPQKRNDLERTIEISVPVPQAMTTQELTQIGQAVKQALNVDKLAWDTAQDQIVIRDRVSRALPAQALLQQLFSWRPEVMIEVEFLEVSDSDLINYGFNVTNTFTATYLGSILNNVVSYPSGASYLLTFGAGKTLIGLGVAQVQAMFNQTLSSTRTLFRAEERAVDGQTATFHVGEKYPVVTSMFAGSVAAGQQGQVYSPPPVFTFQDLGVQVKVTPHIHGMSETTLAIDTSYQLLTGTSVNGIPIIGRREVNTQVRLRDSEWAVVAGLMSPSDSKAVSGFWGLAQIPLIGNLFKQTTRDKEDSNILIVIKPHLLSLPPDQIVTRELRVGTATRPFNPL